MGEPNKVSLKDLTVENITDNVNLINSGCENPRMKFIMQKLVDYLHLFARKTGLTTEEWMAGIQFLTAVGQKCTDVRQEFILLSDILGLSLLVDSVSNPTPPQATQSTILGPFHTQDAEEKAPGGKISNDIQGEPMLVVGTTKDTSGKPIEGVEIDVWETDSTGHYDVQYESRTAPDGRGIVHSDLRGDFWFQAIKPVPYPIPQDGPVGQLLLALHRHPYRPSHVHFKFEKEGFHPLTTALYLRHSPYETSDAVFGVKNTLVVDLGYVNRQTAEKYQVAEGMLLMTYDFVLITNDEANALRKFHVQ